MRKLYAFVLLLLISVGFLSCKKNAPLDESPEFMILPLFEGQRLSTQELNQAQILYQHLGVERQVSDFKRAGSQSAQKGVLTSRDLVVLSAVENVKQFHLVIPGYESIELIIDAERLSEKDARLESCYCDKPIRSVMSPHGPLLKEYTSPKGAHVYKVNVHRY